MRRSTAPSPTPVPRSARLRFRPSPDADVVRYRILIGLASRRYDRAVEVQSFALDPQGVATTTLMGLDAAQRFPHHETKRAQPSVVGEHLHQHLQVWEEVHWLERLPLLRNVPPAIGSLQGSPDAFGFARSGVQEPRHPLIPPQSGARVDHTQ